MATAAKEKTKTKTVKPKKEKAVKAPKEPKEKKPKAPSLPSPFDVLKNMFLRNGVFESYFQNPIIFSRNLFMVNRTCAIKYPLQAQYFNVLGVDPQNVITSWRMFLTKQYGIGRTPFFVYTKGAKASNVEKEKHSELPVFPKDLVYAYCDFYNYTLKDYNDMLEFNPEGVSEHIRRFEQTVIKTDENIEKD